jgi:hypothetical protein
MAALVIGILGYVYRTPLAQVFDELVDESGSQTAAVVSLVIALGLVLLAILWIVFPLMIYLGLRDLRRRTSELDETTRLCARHLARLAAARAPQKVGVEESLPQDKTAQT